MLKRSHLLILDIPRADNPTYLFMNKPAGGITRVNVGNYAKDTYSRDKQ